MAMEIELDIPFVENIDSLHCHQACVGMAIMFFEKCLPTWQELDQLTGFEAGQLTWYMRSFIKFSQRGYKVAVYDWLDYKLFASEPDRALREAYGDEAAEFAQLHSNIATAVRDTKELLKMSSIEIERRIPEIDDLKSLMRDGFVVICNVNQKTIQEDDGYIGHSVIPVAIGDGIIKIHNPGPPAKAFQILTFDRFEKAWSSPDENMRTIMAVKRER